MNNIEKNLIHIGQQIKADAERYQRDPESVLLLAVSKKKPAEDIRLASQFGQKDFGENYLQEAIQKISTLADLDLIWHFIGAIQSNKTRAIAESFDWVHCIDRFKIAERLSAQRPDNLAPLNICIQVNIDGEPGKAGIALDEVMQLATSINQLSNIRLRGLMAIPAPQSDFKLQRQAFAGLAECLQQLQGEGFDCDTLSMGMSGDMDAAIAEGATIVRIGTAIFGERN